MASRRGKRAGAASGSSRTSVHASARPAAPPAADSTRLSVRSCRTSRERLPPSAARIVSSRWRAAPRESSRFAMLAQAMSSTRATALASTRIAGRTVSVRSSTSGRARTTTAPPRPKKNSVDGGRGMLRAAAVPSASACSGVAPGRSRPSVVKTTVRFAWSASAGMAAGIQNSTRGFGNASSGRAIPTMVRRSPSISRVRPTVAGSAANRSRHTRSLSTTAGGAPAASSPSRKKRPIAGVTRNKRNTDGETVAPCRREGSKPGCRTR